MPPTWRGKPVLGVADDTLEPMGFEPSGVILVAGPAQSGRTNAVRWLAESVHRAHPDTPLVHLSARRTPLSALALWSLTGTGDEVGPVLEKLWSRSPRRRPTACPCWRCSWSSCPSSSAAASSRS